MTQWRLMCNPDEIATNGDDIWAAIIGSTIVSTESSVQIRLYTAYTCTNLRIEMSINDVSIVLTLRDDGVDTDPAVSTSATGWAEDLTGSATIAANSLMAYNGVNGGSGHGDDMQMDTALLTIEHASINAPILGTGFRNVAHGATLYNTLGTAFARVTTETNSRTTIQRAMSLSNLFVNAPDGFAFDWNLHPMKNGTASTAITVNVASTGMHEDLTGSETYAANDTGSFEWLRTGGTISDITLWKVDADTPETWLTTSDNVISSTRAYMPFTGEAAFTSTNDEFDMRIGSVSAGSLECFISVAGSGTRDVSLRVGTSNSTNLTINVTTTGYLADLTGSESVSDTDSIMTTAIAPTTDMTVEWAAIECPWTDPSGPAAARRVIITSD